MTGGRFLNMFKKMQRQAIEMHAAGDVGQGETQSPENGDGGNPESLTPVADSIQSKVGTLLVASTNNVWRFRRLTTADGDSRS